MGRPIKNTKMSLSYDAGGMGGKNTIQVTSYFPEGGSATTDATTYIVSQRGSRRFKIHQANSTEALYTIVAKASGSLAAGEFCVQVILDDSTVAYVEKFYNRTIHYITAAGAAGSCTYSLGVAGESDTGGGSGEGSVDGINTGSINVI